MQDKKLCFLKINIKKCITYFCTSYYYDTSNYIKHLISHIYKFFLHNPFYNCISQRLVRLLLIVNGLPRVRYFQCASRLRIRTNHEKWTAWIGFSKMLSLVVHVNFQAYIVQYPNINVLRCIRYSADRHYVRPLSTLGIGIGTLSSISIGRNLV